MKSVKVVLGMLVTFFAFIPFITFAESITNINGIVISEEEYNNFIKVRTHEYIMTMDEAKYEEMQSYNYDNIVTETKYIETIYNRNLNLTTERELTEEEYENYSQTNGNARLDDAGSAYETTAKAITLSVIGGTTWNIAIFTATWKYIPVARSFDVIGMRGTGFEFMNGSQTGEQVYYIDGEYNVVRYAWNGTNIKRFDNGFGISMNIVNDDIDYLQLSIDCDIKATNSYPTLHGSYQHATQNVSLADSQNYTLGSGGLGNVFIFPYSISQRYDGMSGLFIQY